MEKVRFEQRMQGVELAKQNRGKNIWAIAGRWSCTGRHRAHEPQGSFHVNEVKSSISSVAASTASQVLGNCLREWPPCRTRHMWNVPSA